MGVAARTGLVRVSLGRGLSVAEVVRAVREDVRPFALVGRWAGSRAIVGSGPVEVVEGPDVLDVLGEGGGGDGLGVGGGWFGYLGFGLGAAIERLPPPPPRPVPMPVASLGFYDHVLRLDDAGEWWFEALTHAAATRVEELRERLTEHARERAWRLDGLHPGPGATARHTAAVAECVERIAAGDLFQANLCMRLEGRFRGSAADAFIAAATRLEPAYGAFVQLDDDTAVLSFSPELFLRRDGDRVTTSPIKGTAPRAKGADALLASAKDAAEHVMIVDLSRNDLGRVAEYGSVEAHERRVEPHPGLWHLVSDVTGPREARHDRRRPRPRRLPARLRNRRAEDPGAEDDRRPRGHAARGVHGRDRLLEPARRPGAERRDPDRRDRARARVDGMRRRHRRRQRPGRRAPGGAGQGAADRAGARARSVAPAEARERRRGEKLKPWGRRPDPAQGVLETIAVRDGEPVDLARHLERLAASVETLYGTQIAKPVIEPPMRDGVIRVTARRGELEVEYGPPRPPTIVTLEPRSLAGGLGPHKWLDRPHEPHHLAVDLDGSVLEAGAANVWILDTDGTLVTPPADGRILPGLTRARLLEAPQIATQERRLTLTDLEHAEAILLTSSIRLVTPAALHPHAPSAQAQGHAARLRGLVHSLKAPQGHSHA